MCVCIYIGGCHAYPTICLQLSLTFTLRRQTKTEKRKRRKTEYLKEEEAEKEMGRQPCCDKVGLKKGPWTADEDRKLMNFILTHGQCCWRAVPKLAGLLRCGKSCRLRWTNYLRPDLKRGLLSDYEEKMVIDLHSQLGNRLQNLLLFLHKLY